MIWQAEQLENALGVSVPRDIKTGSVQFNSKDINPGDLFIAITVGARDGHEFVADAIARGAAAAIVSKKMPNIDQNKIIEVEDTLEALDNLADYKRYHSNAKFIAVTGSVGKTSTKEALGKMLSEFGSCFISRGNFNNFLGVPISLASMPDDTEFAVIEIGMNARHEISPLTHHVSPHIGIITSVAEGHLEFFKSVEEIADAKCEIFEGLDLNHGVAVVPRDISTYKRCIYNIDKLSLQNVRTFGKSPESEVSILSYEIISENDVRLKYKVFGTEIEFLMPFIPEHIAANFATCLVVCRELKLDLEKAVAGLSKFTMGMGRGRIVDVQKGNKDFKIIADYYNCNPESLKAALTNLGIMDSDKKVAIIGDMGELGVDSPNLHKNIAPYLNSSEVKKVFLVGKLAPLMQADLNPDINCIIYTTTDEAIKDIDKHLDGGELILIKASRFMRFEKIAEHLGVKNAL